MIYLGQKLAKQDKLGGYLLAMPDDLGRFSALTELLSQHQVVFHVVTRDVTVESQTFQANRAIYIPLEQYQYRLVKSLFSTQTSFEDNTFYVSSDNGNDSNAGTETEPLLTIRHALSLVKPGEGNTTTTVSYTHLTLPTKA